MNKRVEIYGLLGMFVFATIAYGWLGRGGARPGATFVNYCRISAGMSVKEVQDLLREPENGPLWRSGTPIRISNQGWIEHWRGSGGSITLIYDVDSRVVVKEWDWSDRNRSFLDDWLGVPQIRE